MSNATRNRQLSMIMDKHYMKANYFIKDKCVYCGDVAIDIDHVPPIGLAYALGTYYRARER